MREAAPQAPQQIFTNRKVLQQQLEEMAAKSKRPDRTKREERRQMQGPVLVIRGK